MLLTTESSTRGATAEVLGRFTPAPDLAGPQPQVPLPAVRLFATVKQALRDHYEDIEAIGTGRSGFVLRAHAIVAADAPPREEWVALKVLYPGTADTSGISQRFHRQARVGAKLRHPNIASVSEVRTSQGVSWFEMPFLTGLRLDRTLLNERTLTMAHAIGILKDLASALDYAAAQGVAHGALRPSEVVIQHDGHAVLTGFLLDRSEEQPGHRSLSPSSLGDPAYMAPEQWSDGPVVGPLADQYSLAVLAAELIGGNPRVARNGAGMAEVVPFHIGHTQPLRPGLGLHVNEALLRAMARDQWLRFPSCSAFVLALAEPSRTEHHAPETHRAPEIRPRFHHWWRFTLVLAAVVAAAALFVMR